MARELNTRERQLCATIAEQKPWRRATQRYPASELVILTRIPGRRPKFEHRVPPPTHVDRGRQVQTTASSPRGTFSQAELTAERVITRCITRQPPTAKEPVRACGRRRCLTPALPWVRALHSGGTEGRFPADLLAGLCRLHIG
jgi:hypothetical protein